MSTLSKKASRLVLSYVFLRKCIGGIGIALPPVLILGKILLESPGISNSISAYYYSVMRDVFVGSLCTIAVFLLCYRYKWPDDMAGILAGSCAIGVALFPTTPNTGATQQQVLIGWVHLVFALGFFGTLAFFALVLFRKTDQQHPTRRKLQRNMVYLCCGLALIACLVLICLVQLLPGSLWFQPLHPVFWLEALAILAFGIAWFVKGETILKDV